MSQIHQEHKILTMFSMVHNFQGLESQVIQLQTENADLKAKSAGLEAKTADLEANKADRADVDKMMSAQETRVKRQLYRPTAFNYGNNGKIPSPHNFKIKKL